LANDPIKIISPFALATAYFAMPPAVIPFNLTHQAFVIFTFVIMAVVALLFVITETIQNRNWWNKKFAGCMKIMRLEELEHRLWTRNSGNPPIPQRSHSGLQTDQPWTSRSSV
jgi:hypothetical protein